VRLTGILVGAFQLLKLGITSRNPKFEQLERFDDKKFYHINCWEAIRAPHIILGRSMIHTKLHCMCEHLRALGYYLPVRVPCDSEHLRVTCE
jgi:hypothetical protein